MKLGDNIYKNRKKCHLSQEQLAEYIDVTRQTISNWETGLTSPNPEQLKLLSKVLNISIDELLDNDVNSVLISKVSNTEKLAGIIIKMIKIIGICLIVIAIIIFIICLSFVVVPNSREDREIYGKATIKCNIEDEEYSYEIEYNRNFQPINSGGDAWISNHIDVEKYEDVNQIVAHIDDYFKSHGGKCNIDMKDN